jgi:nitrogenase molybdenum-iron protein alpha/beta subunit
MAIPFKPVNLGDARKGGSLRPSKAMNPTNHWDRDLTPDFEVVANGLEHITTVAAVFDSRQKAEEFLKAVKRADLGLSINISTSIDGAEQCCHAAGIPRHSVGYSLGFEGKTEKLPNTQVMSLMTMCGHGMVAQSLAKKMIDWVKEGRRTPEQAATYMQRFCSCGVFNPARAVRILEDARHRTK